MSDEPRDYSMAALISQFLDDMERSKQQILSAEDPEREVEDLADHWVPVYSRTLALYLADNLGLGLLDDTLETDNVFTAIAVGIRQELEREGIGLLLIWQQEDKEN